MQGIIIYINASNFILLLKITVKYLNIYFFVIYDILRLLHFFFKTIIVFTLNKPFLNRYICTRLCSARIVCRKCVYSDAVSMI